MRAAIADVVISLGFRSAARSTTAVTVPWRRVYVFDPGSIDEPEYRTRIHEFDARGALRIDADDDIAWKQRADLRLEIDRAAGE